MRAGPKRLLYSVHVGFLIPKRSAQGVMQQPLLFLTTSPLLLIVVPYLLSNPFSIQTGGTTMTSLRQQMTEEMQLRGLSSRTQQSYLNAVRQLAE